MKHIVSADRISAQTIVSLFWPDSSYLLLHVVERVRRIDGEADQDDVRVRVGKRSEAVVIFLTSSIP
jgi:hypothetical protein